MTRLTRTGAGAIVLALQLLTPVPALAQAAKPEPPPVEHRHGSAEPQAKPVEPAAGHEHHRQPLPANVPPLTEEDRKAAFPDVRGHAVHDSAIHYVAMFDRFEWQADSDVGWDSSAWIGRDRNRMWLRSEGRTEDGRLDDADVHVLYGHAFARWWDVVGGIRQDFRPGPAQTWAAIGIQGLAPYWFDVEATAYVGAGGRTAGRVEVEYDLLLTNRAVLQPLVEINFAGKRDPERGVGAGVTNADLGFRVRYELRREIAPYAGIAWSWKIGETADFARSAGHDVSGVRLVAGVRWWL